MSDKRAGRAPALFDDAAFVEDLDRASDAGRQIAHAARQRHERAAVPVEHLLACEDEGPEGTALVHAFGVRHHPAESRAPMVYEIAHRRLNEST